MAYWGKVWTLVAWCELRDDLRHFRFDRMRALQVSDEAYPDEPGKTLQDFFLTLPAEDRP